MHASHIPLPDVGSSSLAVVAEATNALICAAVHAPSCTGVGGAQVTGTKGVLSGHVGASASPESADASTPASPTALGGG
jgi:hypothetical protein